MATQNTQAQIQLLDAGYAFVPDAGATIAGRPGPKPCDPEFLFFSNEPNDYLPFTTRSPRFPTPSPLANTQTAARAAPPYASAGPHGPGDNGFRSAAR
jgi:hypothetical protein